MPQISYKLLDKLATITRQAPGPGNIASVTTVGSKIKCAKYDGSGWAPSSGGGTFTFQSRVLVGDQTGSQIQDGLQEGDFINPGPQYATYVVRGVKAYQNARISGMGIIYDCNCEIAPSGQV
jgi:hypothetical protein